MNTFFLVVLTAAVAGFLSRASKLYSLIKSALYYSAFEKDVTPVQAQFQNASAGCLGLLCFPFFFLFIALLVYLFFKVNWKIPVSGYLIGLTLGNLIGYLIDRIFRLPNHQKMGNDSFDLNAFELSRDIVTYRRALGLLIFYNVTSLVISLIIMFYV